MNPDHVRQQQLFGFALFMALWPVLIVHTAYAISIIEGHVPPCNPYWDGCTSISRAARHGWANHLFQAALLPYSALLAVYWWLCQRWLRALGDVGSRAMLLIGWVGMLFMILYVTFLGTEGQVYQLMRRYGINGYFGGTYIAQVVLIGRLRTLQNLGRVPWPGWLVPSLLLLASSVLGMGLLFVATDYGLPLDRDRLQNTLEWIAALLMQMHVLLIAVAWRYSGFGSRFTAR